MVDQPHLIKKYNENIGVVDRCDQNISLYRVSIRGKKQYIPLFCHCVDMAEQNAWQLHKSYGGQLDHLAFRRAMAIGNIQKDYKKGASRKSANFHEHSKYDRLDHLGVFQENQTRCGLCHKKCNSDARNVTQVCIQKNVLFYIIRCILYVQFCSLYVFCIYLTIRKNKIAVSANFTILVI